MWNVYWHTYKSLNRYLLYRSSLRIFSSRSRRSSTRCSCSCSRPPSNCFSSARSWRRIWLSVSWRLWLMRLTPLISAIVAICTGVSSLRYIYLCVCLCMCVCIYETASPFYGMCVCVCVCVCVCACVYNPRIVVRRALIRHRVYVCVCARARVCV